MTGCPSWRQPARIREETLKSGNLFNGNEFCLRTVATEDIFYKKYLPWQGGDGVYPEAQESHVVPDEQDVQLAIQAEHYKQFTCTVMSKIYFQKYKIIIDKPTVKKILAKKNMN